MDASPEMAGMGMPEVILEGEVLECDPPFKLVQTWHRSTSRLSRRRSRLSTLTYEIHPENEQLTRLTVTHDVTDAPQVRPR